MNDTVQRFHFSHSPVRGEVVQLGSSIAEVLSRHHYPARVAQLLAEALAASVLLTSTLKFEGSLILQVQGDGPIETLMVECNHRREIRGIAQVSEHWRDTDSLLPLSGLFGNAQLAITIDPEQGERYQGIVPLDGETLAACLEHYFAQSEQLPTRLWLAAEGNLAAGLLLQVLPGHNASEDDHSGAEPDADIWPRLCLLTNTVKNEELLTLPATELLYRLYHEETVELSASSTVSFSCHCSLARTEQVLLSLGEEELKEMIADQGDIEITCQFCNQEYRFDPIDLERLLRGSRSAPQQLH